MQQILSDPMQCSSPCLLVLRQLADLLCCPLVFPCTVKMIRHHHHSTSEGSRFKRNLLKYLFCVFIFIWCFIFQFWKYPKKKSVVCKIPDLLSVWLIEAVALRARDCHRGVDPSCSLHILSHHCHTLSHSLHPHPPLCQRPSPQEHSRSRASR